MLAGGFFLFRTVVGDVNDYLMAAAAALLMLLEPHLLWIALSGMETTLFIALTLASLYYYKRRQPVMLGICTGLLVWTRPEGLVLPAALAVDLLYHTYALSAGKERKKRKDLKPSPAWIKNALVICAALCILYAGFNLWLSGTFFPNTLAAKMKYYGSLGRDFDKQVWGFFTGRHLAFFWFMAALGAAGVVANVLKRKASPELVPLLFSLGLLSAYWITLPVFYQEGRYLMPVLPFFIILGIYGIRLLVSGLTRFAPSLKHIQFAGLILVLFFIYQFVHDAWNGRAAYAEACQYIGRRQVLAGHWLHDHLPGNAVIATHDVGAIAYYSDRRIVDMVGLISPDMIPNIGSLDRLRSFLIAKRATHLAVLRNWFEIDNQPLLFHTDEDHPEILDITAFDRSRTHFVPQNATRTRDAAQYYYAMGDYRQAGAVLQQALNEDPGSSRTHYLIAKTLLALGRTDDAEKEFNNTLMLYPGFAGAETGLAEVALRRNQPSDAIAKLEQALKTDPEDPESYRLLASIYREFQIDSTKADEYAARYNELRARKPE